MSKWAARLAGIGQAEKSAHTPQTVLTKPPKAPFVSFDSAPIEGLPKKWEGEPANDIGLDLLARIHSRFMATCERLTLSVPVVMRRFDQWRYGERELIVMNAWPDEIIEAHCELLHYECAS